MVLTKLGFNVSGLSNVTPINITTPSTPAGFMEEIPSKANEITGGFFGLTVMIGLFAYLYWVLTDKSSYGDFGFSSVRAFGITGCIVGIMGWFMLSLGYFVNYFHVVLFLAIGMISTIWVYVEERK